MSVPIGRQAELERAGYFLAQARERFVVHLLEGEAGIGKTAIFDEAVRQARESGMLVLRSRTAQAEARLALSVVADLMESAPPTTLDELAAPQRRALEVALLRADAGDEPIGDRALAVAVRSVLVALSKTQPVVVAIDDLHWLDPASAAVLAHVLRRLSDEPMGLLATRRLGERLPLKVEDLVAADALHRQSIGPLSMGSVHHLIKEHLGQSLARPTLLRIHQASGGNPLFALEIGRTLIEAGPLQPGQPMPIPPDVESLVRMRVLRLPATTREVLLAAAALAEPRLALLREALGRAIDDDLVTAEGRGVASLDRDVIRFRHPLFSSALYASVPAVRRRGLHAHLATVVDDAEERARHLALAVSGRDEETARMVHAISREASRRGAPTAAIELLELAQAVGDPDLATRAQRAFDLAENLARAGDNARARELLDAVDPWTGWPKGIHGAALDLMLELTYWLNGPGVEVDRLGDQLLGGTLPPDVRAQVHASLARYTEHDLPRALEHADAALRELDALGDRADPLVRATALAIRVRNRLVLGDGLDRDRMREALEIEAAIPSGHPGTPIGADGFGQWLKYVDELDESRALLESGLERDLAAGYEKGALNKLQHLALTECLAGNLDLAREHAVHACELYELERSRLLGYAHAILAIVEAHRGQVDAVRSVQHMYRAQGSPVHLMAAVGLLELSLGNDQAALDSLSAALDAQRDAGLREPGIHRVHANAAEAAVALGELDRAAAITEELERHAGRVGHRWSLAAGARCRALLLAAHGDLAGAIAKCGEAMTWHESLPMPFERARTLLVKGVIERRARRRREAHRSLLEAAEAFEGMGARIWAERARGELERVGLRRSSGDALTEGERRCAELAAAGMTNREVAAALFISPKTVEANLARAYRKLGVASRAELGSRMREFLQT